MDKQQAYQSVRQHLREWEQALAAVDAVHAKYGAAGKPGPDVHYSQSGPPIGAEGVEEIRKAENRALRKWEELQEAMERWNGMVLKARPLLQEILKTLRANMPMLKAEYGVASIAVIGPYAKGDDYEAGRLELMVDYQRVPDLIGFIEHQEKLGDLLGVKVGLVTKSVITEREPYLLDGAVLV